MAKFGLSFSKKINGHLAARKLEVLCDGVCEAVVLSLSEKLRARRQARMAGPPAPQNRRRHAEMARLVVSVCAFEAESIVL